MGQVVVVGFGFAFGGEEEERGVGLVVGAFGRIAEGVG